MVTGVSAGAWGYSPRMVAGMNNPMEMNGKQLTYDLNLSSIPPTFDNGNYVSPLTKVNESYYKKTSEFGKRRKLTLKQINKMIKVLKKQKF
jgi:hypothetical protein